MKKFKIIMVLIVLAAIAGGGYAGYNYWYDIEHYFTTENASISADMVTITPLVTGSVASWNVREGDDVTAGQILGRQDLGTMVSSSDINAKSLNSSADSLVSKADIKTPIAGKVVQSNVIQGETISPGMQVAVVADSNNMYVKANIEETDIFKIKTGQKVTIFVDAYPKRTFTGYVERIGQATQSAFSIMPTLNTSGTYTKVTQLIPIQVSIMDDENTPFLLGMNATVKIKIK